MHIPRTARAMLEQYLLDYGPFIVQHSLDPPSKWREYGTIEYYEKYDYRIPKHRLIFKNEIVIEPDVKNKALNDSISKKICARLEHSGISYTRWHSGNKSNHIHIFFKDLEKLNDSFRPIAKWEIIKFFCYLKI